MESLSASPDTLDVLKKYKATPEQIQNNPILAMKVLEELKKKKQRTHEEEELF